MTMANAGGQHTLGDPHRKTPPEEWNLGEMLAAGNAMYQQAALLESARRATNQNTATLLRVARAETRLAVLIGGLTAVTAVDVVLRWSGMIP